MKRLLITSLLTAALGLSTQVQASTQTVTLGYAHSEMKDVTGINGVNVKYRYEWDSPLSVIGSLTYMGGSREETDSTPDDFFRNKADIKYYSLSAGPAYRINSWISIYGLVGINYNNAKYANSWEDAQPGSSCNSFEESGTLKKASFMYGAGVQINPTENIAIDIGYEGSRLKDLDESYAINGFNIGVGYRF